MLGTRRLLPSCRRRSVRTTSARPPCTGERPFTAGSAQPAGCSGGNHRVARLQPSAACADSEQGPGVLPTSGPRAVCAVAQVARAPAVRLCACPADRPGRRCHTSKAGDRGVRRGDTGADRGERLPRVKEVAWRLVECARRGFGVEQRAECRRPGFQRRRDGARRRQPERRARDGERRKPDSGASCAGDAYGRRRATISAVWTRKRLPASERSARRRSRSRVRSRWRASDVRPPPPATPQSGARVVARGVLLRRRAGLPAALVATIPLQRTSGRIGGSLPSASHSPGTQSCSGSRTLSGRPKSRL